MNDMPSSELLQPGQNPAGLAEGGVPQLGATHEANAGSAGGGLANLEPERGGRGEPNEAEIISELQKYERNWGAKSEADKDKFLPAWEMIMKAKLGSKSADKWCQDNKLSLSLHGEVFVRLAAKRRGEKMTTAEKAQGLTAEFLIFREVLPHILNNKELVDQRTILAPQQGGQNVARS